MPRRPPHFKLYASAQNHRKMPGVWADDALLAMYARAGVLCVERFADRTGNVALVNRLDLQRVANCSPWANAQRKLRRLVAATPVRLRCACSMQPEDRRTTAGEALDGRWTVAGGPLDGRCKCAAIELEIPNFSEKQGFKHENGRETERERGSSASAASSSSSESNLNPPVVPLAGDPAGERQRTNAAAALEPEPPAKAAATPQLFAEPDRLGKPEPKRPGRPRSGAGNQPAPEALAGSDLEKLAEWARTNEPWALPELPDLAAKCLDHHGGIGRGRVDWVRTARNWIRKEREIRAERRERAGPARVVAMRGSRPQVSNSKWAARPRTETA